MSDDFRFQRIEPAECPHCPGQRHWPHNCPTPQGRAQAQKEIGEITNGIADTLKTAMREKP